MLTLLYFFSGAAGLLYEVAWFRRLQLVFGVSTFAIGAVVSAFMLGLAAGSRWAGSTRLVTRRPLLAYSFQEGAIALYACLFPLLVIGAERVYSALFPSLGGHFVALSGIRLVLSLGLLLPATFCMGATLPTLGQVVARSGVPVASVIGRLYAVNTFGAVVGALAAGFYALEHLGIRGTIWLAAVLNLLVAAVAFAMSYRLGEHLVPAEEASPASTEITEPTGATEPQKTVAKHLAAKIHNRGARQPCKGQILAGRAPLIRIAMLVVALVGFVSMASEVIWTRALVFYIHNSTYAFSAILAIYLLGLGVGAGVASRAIRRASTTAPCTDFQAAAGQDIVAVRFLGWTLLATCASALIAICVYRGLPLVAKPLLGGETLAPQLAGLPDRSFWVIRSWGAALLAVFAQAGAVLFLPAFIFGLTFPVALRLAETCGGDARSIVGRLYASNNLGDVAGTMVAAFGLVALLGTQGTLVLLAWLPLPLAFWLLHKASRAARPCWRRFALMTAALVGLTLVAAPPGFYRAQFERRFGKVLWFSEGAAETVAVCRHADNSAWIHYSDGRGASGTTSYRGGWLYAHIPLLLHPDPHSALVICFGTGNTLGAASLYHLDRLDGVELSREVVKASAFFKESNHGVAEAPGVHIVVEDGRNYLLGSDRRYDVITEEPPLVHTAGVVNLYSRDFYKLCAAHLNDNGIMAVWLATWELEEPEVKMLVRAFVEAFPYTSAWDSQHVGEWILVGSLKPISVDVEKLSQRMREPVVAADLSQLGIRSPADFLALYMVGGAFLDEFSRGTPSVTDDRTVVDYTIPRHARSNFGLGEWLTGGLNVSGVSPAGLVSELRVRGFDAVYAHREPASSFLAQMRLPSTNLFLADLDQRRVVAETVAGRKLAWNIMATASDYQVIGRLDKSLSTLDWGTNIVGHLPSADLLVMKANLFRAHGRLEDARSALAAAIQVDPNNEKALKLKRTLLPPPAT